MLDLGSRRLPGFAISEHHDSALAKAALCMAAAVRGGDVAGVVFHTDKGGEYVGDLFARACQALGVTQSMGRVGSALDNAAAESFNSTLEHELLSRRRFETKDQARREVARFIDAYNHRRRHSSCEMLPPVAYEPLLAAASRRQRAAAGAGGVKPASQIASERLEPTRWHQGAGECEAPSAISNPPRFRGKPSPELAVGLSTVGDEGVVVAVGLGDESVHQIRLVRVQHREVVLGEVLPVGLHVELRSSCG